MSCTFLCLNAGETTHTHTHVSKPNSSEFFLFSLKCCCPHFFFCRRLSRKKRNAGGGKSAAVFLSCAMELHPLFPPRSLSPSPLSVTLPSSALLFGLRGEGGEEGGVWGRLFHPSRGTAGGGRGGKGKGGRDRGGEPRAGAMGGDAWMCSPFFLSHSFSLQWKCDSGDSIFVIS